MPAAILTSCIALSSTTMSGTAAAAEPIVFKGGWAFTANNNQGSSSGDVNFYNRSIGITGTVRKDLQAGPACVRVEFTAYWANGGFSVPHARTTCGAPKGFSFTIEAHAPGGAEWVHVTILTAPSNTSKFTDQGTYVSENRGN